MSAKAETFSVRLPESTCALVDHLAQISKRSRSYIINAAVEAYVKDRAAYLQDLDEAVATAENGVNFSAEKIFEWMNSWGTKNELPSPHIPDVFPTK
jgi:predicted transcriptional regulator